MAKAAGSGSAVPNLKQCAEDLKRAAEEAAADPKTADPAALEAACDDCEAACATHAHTASVGAAAGAIDPASILALVAAVRKMIDLWRSWRNP